MISDITLEELQSATRNQGMPREWLQYEVTPIGMHYLLIHFDIPHVEEAKWRLQIDGRVTETLALSGRDQIVPESDGSGHDRMRGKRPCNDDTPAEKPALARRAGGYR